jgi:hypothetical protein
MSTESQEQQGFITWFRLKYPSILIFHIPNGGYRNIVTGQRLKKEGVVAGIPDLYIPRAKIWIEMKTSTGKLSPEQVEMHRYLRAIGDTVIVGYGAEDASKKILELI